MSEPREFDGLEGRCPFVLVIDSSDEHRRALADPGRFGVPIAVPPDPPRKPRAPTGLIDAINRAADHFRLVPQDDRVIAAIRAIPGMPEPIAKAMREMDEVAKKLRLPNSDAISLALMKDKSWNLL